MRIASLVPSATEMLFALGLGPRVAAVTHECDHPAEVSRLPRLTRTMIPEGLDAAGIDAAVRNRVGASESLYELDAHLLERLGVDLIVTQELCAVCAVSSGDVRAVAERMPARPAVVSLDPMRLGEVLDDAVRLGEAAGDRASGERVRAGLARRIDTVRGAVAGVEPVRVAALEWLDPPFGAGHWLPDMIAAAGGTDVLAEPGERSRELGWEEVEVARPDVVVVMPCGLDAAGAEAEALRNRERLAAFGASALFAVDAAASFSRPGPRLADGVELLGHLLHPDLVPAPTLGWATL